MMIILRISIIILLVAVLHVAAQVPAKQDSSSTSYSTDQILAYLQAKAFGSLIALPNARGSIGARHSLWQAGATDAIDDFVYTDHNNTRLEAKIEIPIFDLSYLRNRKKERLEFQAVVMKSLSKILAAQKSVIVLERRFTTINQRHTYTKNQIDLKLANRSDLFTIEDNMFSVQNQLHEAQSTLEQRVLDLATIAEDDWLDAYEMIIKWDGVLINRKITGKKK